MAKKKRATKKKVFKHAWVYEPLEEFEDFFTKRMFGGLAIYVHGKMTMMLAEDPGNREYRGEVYSFDIWNGVLFPTYYELQEDILKQYPQLVQHPILKKWLYLPESDQSFDSTVAEIVENIVENDQRFGIYPKI